MKLKHQVSLFVGSAGMTTLVAILLSAREQLLIISPAILDMMIAAAGSALLYGGFRVYVAGKHHWLAIQAQEQQMRIAQERHAWEMRAIQADIHVKTSYLLPDQNGNYPMIVPTIVDMLPEHLAGQVMAFAPGQTKGMRVLPEQAQSRQNEQQNEEEEASLPDNIRYEQIKHLIPPGHGLQGVSATSVETCEFQDFMTMLISGGSNSGKSNTVGLKINEAISYGRNVRLIVIDWHWRKPDSLYNKIKAYEDRFLMPAIKTEEETLPALQWFFNEFKRRLTDGVTTQDSDIFLIVDEVPAIMDAEDEQIAKMLKLIARKCGREARGFGMFGWFIAQQVIGLSWLRNVVHTNIAHKATRINEAEIACNDHKDIARDMENWPQGRVIVYGQNFTGVKVLQMPIFTPQATVIESTITDDQMEPLQPKQRFPNSSIIDFQTQQWKRNGVVSETALEKAGNDTDELSEESAATLKKMLQDIRERRSQGTPLNTILREYGINGGRAHQEVKQLLDEMEAIN